jgi:hypothetical protein
LGPIKTTFILSAAVQGGILGWGNGFNRGFQVATLKSGFAGVFEELCEILVLKRIRAEQERRLFLIHGEESVNWYD